MRVGGGEEGGRGGLRVMSQLMVYGPEELQSFFIRCFESPCRLSLRLPPEAFGAAGRPMLGWP